MVTGTKIDFCGCEKRPENMEEMEEKILDLQDQINELRFENELLFKGINRLTDANNRTVAGCILSVIIFTVLFILLL